MRYIEGLIVGVTYINIFCHRLLKVLDMITYLTKFYGGACMLRKCKFTHQFKKTVSVGLTHKSFSERKISDRVLIRNEDKDQKQPLVVIIGWGNCKMKQLFKYSEIFEKQNFTSVCVTTTLVNSLLRFDTAGKRESLELKNVLVNLLQNNSERQVIFYLFSNGALTLYYYIAKDLNSNVFLGKNIKGTIFDSSPIVPNYNSPEIVKQAFISAYRKRNIVVTSAGNFIKLFVYVLVTWKKELEEVFPQLIKLNISSPQLVLFSKNDNLAPYDDILKFIQERRSHGFEVSYKLWEKSGHVAHLKHHNEEYVVRVKNFIDHCMQSQ